jgi:ureidoglycolate lyase
MGNVLTPAPEDGMAPRLLRVEPLSGETFALFGDVMTAAGTGFDLVNDGSAQVFRDLARIDPGAGGRARFSIVRARPTAFPLTVVAMERHPLGSQAFWPLGGAAMLAVVAPAGPFDPAALRAFHCPAGSGLNYRIGVWHHALIAIARISDFIVIDRAGPGENYETATLPERVVIESSFPIT